MCGVREAREERVVDGGRYLCLVMLKDYKNKGGKVYVGYVFVLNRKI